jgi:hypothetical protein
LPRPLPERHESSFIIADATLAGDARVKLSLAAVRFRDGRMVLRHVLGQERIELLRAGFRPFTIRLAADRGGTQEADLWMQEKPSLADYLNAANLVFLNEPGSLSWD